MSKTMLLTQADRKALPKLYATENLSDQEKTIPVKFFSAFGSGRWYAIEFDGEDRFFGYVTGLGDDELGYFSLSEMESITFRGAPAIERDRHWNRNTTLADVVSGKTV